MNDFGCKGYAAEGGHLEHRGRLINIEGKVAGTVKLPLSLGKAHAGSYQVQGRFTAGPGEDKVRIIYGQEENKHEQHQHGNTKAGDAAVPVFVEGTGSFVSNGSISGFHEVRIPVPAKDFHSVF